MPTVLIQYKKTFGPVLDDSWLVSLGKPIIVRSPWSTDVPYKVWYGRKWSHGPSSTKLPFPALLTTYRISNISWSSCGTGISRVATHRITYDRRLHTLLILKLHSCKVKCEKSLFSLFYSYTPHATFHATTQPPILGPDTPSSSTNPFAHSTSLFKACFTWEATFFSPFFTAWTMLVGRELDLSGTCEGEYSVSRKIWGRHTYIGSSWGLCLES